MVAAITEDTAQFAVGGAPQPKYQGKNALSDDVTLGSSTMPDSPTTPMGVYVSGFVPSFPTFLFIFSCLVFPEPK